MRHIKEIDRCGRALFSLIASIAIGFLAGLSADFAASMFFAGTFAGDILFSVADGVSSPWLPWSVTMQPVPFWFLWCAYNAMLGAIVVSCCRLVSNRTGRNVFPFVAGGLAAWVAIGSMLHPRTASESEMAELLDSLSETEESSSVLPRIPRRMFKRYSRPFPVWDPVGGNEYSGTYFSAPSNRLAEKCLELTCEFPLRGESAARLSRSGRGRFDAHLHFSGDDRLCMVGYSVWYDAPFCNEINHLTQWKPDWAVTFDSNTTDATNRAPRHGTAR